MPTVEAFLEVYEFYRYFFDETQVELALVEFYFVGRHRLSAVIPENLREEVLLLEALFFDNLEDDFAYLLDELVGVVTAELLGVLQEGCRGVDG